MKHLKVRIPMYTGCDRCDIRLLYNFLQLYGILSSNTGKSCNPHYHGTCQHCICRIRYLFVFAGRSDSTCRRGLYAGGFLCNTY